MINKDSHTSLSTSSQKGVDIEKSSQPRALNIGEDTRFLKLTPYVRKKKGVKETRALREHTPAQHKAPNLDVEPFNSSLDSFQTKADMHPQSLSISPTYNSPRNLSYIVIIDNMAMSNSPSLKLLKEPTLSIDTHQVEKYNLLECQSFISSLVIDTVISHQQSISQSPSTDILSTDISHLLITSSSMDISSTDISSTDISYPLIISSSMDTPHSSTTNPSTDQETQMHIISEFQTSIDEQLIISTLLGLSGGGENEERLGCSKEKGEDECEKHLISSKDASEGAKESTGLVVEEKGELVRKVSKDEIRIKEKRESRYKNR